MIVIPLTRGKVAVVDEMDSDLANYLWCSSKVGYAVRREPKSRKHLIRMHRVVLSRIMGRELLPSEGVDHINGDKSDNRRINLRLANQVQNLANRDKQSNNKSGFKGVSFHKPTRKWRVSIGKEYIGLFDSPIDGAFVYDVAAFQKYGEFARLNLPRQDYSDIEWT